MKALACWLLAAASVAGGCAHHHGNTYAYAPPYAPPVYPQPPGVAQPVAYGAPVSGAPVVTVPGLATASPGVVVASQTSPCPQGCPEGSVAGQPVLVEGGGQTPPCPPGP